jgi:general secretion pathway protein E
MSKLNIAERRLPQDGRIKQNIAGKKVDLRVATLPTLFGEGVVMRILDQGNINLDLSNLGFPPGILPAFERLITSSHGMILVTGPTGSGKTTTLYAALQKINTPEAKIITIEDPIEYVLPGVNQIQINPQAGLTFASGLRSIVRQDPDIILVGEIRDFETAEVAIQAALTGHLVFSTLHTNDATSAITRLLDMGIKDYLVASSVIGILAQRLVRTICPYCKEPYYPHTSLLKAMGLESEVEATFYRGKGCDKCAYTGYKGRTGIYELLVISDEIRNLIGERVDSEQIKKRATALGMSTLIEDGIEKAKEGSNTPEEVLRVAYKVA